MWRQLIAYAASHERLASISLIRNAWLISSTRDINISKMGAITMNAFESSEIIKWKEKRVSFSLLRVYTVYSVMQRDAPHRPSLYDKHIHTHRERKKNTFYFYAANCTSARRSECIESWYWTAVYTIYMNAWSTAMCVCVVEMHCQLSIHSGVVHDRNVKTNEKKSM